MRAKPANSVGVRTATKNEFQHQREVPNDEFPRYSIQCYRSLRETLDLPKCKSFDNILNRLAAKMSRSGGVRFLLEPHLTVINQSVASPATLLAGEYLKC